jgi:hypothetical protein
VTCNRLRPRVSPQVKSSSRGLHSFVLLGVLLIAVLSKQAAGDDQSPLPAADKGHEKPYALIFGTVWGPDDRPIYGVKVNVRRANEKKVRWRLASDHNGEFALRVPAGRADYVVSADLKDFKSLPGKQLLPGKDAQVHIENDERFDMGLHLIIK